MPAARSRLVRPRVPAIRGGDPFPGGDLWDSEHAQSLDEWAVGLICANRGERLDALDERLSNRVLQLH